MHSVRVYHCTVCWNIRSHVVKVMAALLEDGVIAESVAGEPYEFRVVVDGRVVLDKIGDGLPDVEQLCTTVEEAILLSQPQPAYEAVA